MVLCLTSGKLLYANALSLDLKELTSFGIFGEGETSAEMAHAIGFCQAIDWKIRHVTGLEIFSWQILERE